MKKAIYKKWWFWVLVIFALGGIGTAMDKPEEQKKEVAEETKKAPTPKVTEESTLEPTPESTEKEIKKPKATKKPKVTKKPKKKSLKAQVKEAVQGYIDDNYILTDIDYISVNDDLGTKKKGDYISLIHLIWSGVANETAKKNITKYSNDIAARMYGDFPQMQEVAVFWDVEISGDKAKMAFVRKKNGMYLDNEYWDLAFNE